MVSGLVAVQEIDIRRNRLLPTVHGYVPNLGPALIAFGFAEAEQEYWQTRDSTKAPSLSVLAKLDQIISVFLNTCRHGKGRLVFL
jgi:hypothetical protein